MAKFGKRSRACRSTCHEDLKMVLDQVIQHFDFSILTGHRGEEAQNEAFATGHSGKEWPTSKHNSFPSIAVDIAPWPINWKDRERFTYLAGHMKMAASMLGLELRWGGDWDRDTEVADNSFDDLVHFELVR